MAFKPSERRSVKIESTELDLRPIMNMMCILIPLLLSCSQFVKNTFIEMKLPGFKNEMPGTHTLPDVKTPEPERLNLQIVVTEKGITIASRFGVFGMEQSIGGPTLPKLNNRYDYEGLKKKLKDIVQRVESQDFDDKRAIMITAEDAVEYQSIVTIMDVVSQSATKELRDAATGMIVKEPWFEMIGLNKFIL